MPDHHLQQCSHCGDVYCSTCSVSNYDSHEDRVFCLECAEVNGAAQH